MSDKVRITVLSGVSAGDNFNFRIAADAPLTIGRDPGNVLVLHDPKVSRKHARIELDGTGYKLIDEGSSHGTVHMGFRLSAGADAGRSLRDDDEFKIGDAIFRFHCEEKKQPVASPAKGAQAVTPPTAKIAALRSKPLYLVIVALVAVLVGISFIDGGGNSALPRQFPDVVYQLPQKRVLGYIPVAKSALHRDSRHADKVRIRILPGDQLIEYEYFAQAPIVVSVDGTQITTLPPVEGWTKGAIVASDLMSGAEREVVFDNVDFPRKDASRKKLKQWGVYDVRTRPLDQVIDVSPDAVLQQTIAVTNTIDNTPEALYLVVQQYYQLAVTLIAESKLPAVAISLHPEQAEPRVEELKSKLESMARERRLGVTPQMCSTHLDIIKRFCGMLDAELWRRHRSRIHQVNLAKEVENFIEAYDQLLAIKRMIPDEFDARYIEAEELFLDEDIIPEKLRRDPVRYRKSLARGRR